VIDWVLLALRLWLGIVMLAHGFHHARSLTGTAKWFDQKGFTRPIVTATLSAGGELAIGASFVLGFLTPFAVAGLVATMTIAFWAVHRASGFFVFRRPDEGWEYVATLSLVAAVIGVLGPGRFSADSLLGWGWVDGWTGAIVVAFGLVIAAIQLLIGWRRPQERGEGGR